MMYDRYYGRHFSVNLQEKIKQSFRKGSALTRLIYINCGIFLLLKLIYVVMLLLGKGTEFYSFALEWMGVPADIDTLLSRPWTLLTYMFTHFEFLHLLFNVLWLYWFGSIFLNHFTERKLTGVYLLGGIFGALLYIAAYNIFPYFNDPQYPPFPHSALRLSSWAIGASASVMAIVFAVCTYLPQQQIYIFLIGPVKLIYLAIFTAIIDLLSISSGNAGGHIAHLGGALFGWFFVLALKKNIDIASGFIQLFEQIGKLFRKKKKLRVKYKKKVSEMNDQEYNAYKKNEQDRINEILDKISRSGYESLTREEKAILFKAKN